MWFLFFYPGSIEKQDCFNPKAGLVRAALKSKLVHRVHTPQGLCGPLGLSGPQKKYQE